MSRRGGGGRGPAGAAGAAGADGAAGASGSTFNVTAVKTSAYTAVSGDLVLVNTSGGTFAVTLPTAVGVSGQRIGVLRTTGTTDLTFLTTSAQTIAGAAAASYVLLGSAGMAVTIFVSDGSNWQVMAPDVALGGAYFNTTDHVTNYELALMAWVSNVFRIGTSKGGTGTNRNLVLFAGSASLTFGASSNAITLASQIAAGTNVAGIDLTNNSVSFSATSGAQYHRRSAATINQASGTASFDGDFLNYLFTAVGSGGANFCHYQSNSVDMFRVDQFGKITQSATNTAGGTTGNQTINKPTGKVNIAAGGTTVTVTNSLVSTSSIVFPVVLTNDATAQLKNVVCSAGSFVITMVAAVTAETSIGFEVKN